MFNGFYKVKFLNNSRKKIVKRKTIKEIPKKSNELYIRFEIEEWKELQRPIKVQGYQVRQIIYAKEFLLNNAEIVTELCIKSKEEFRIWYELKRIDKEVQEILNNKNNKKQYGISTFKIWYDI